MRKYCLYMGILLVVLVILRMFLFEVYAVSQTSMKNTYLPGDRILILKNGYSIERNDILVFERENANVVKRCIGLPGDTITIRSGEIYCNGKQLERPYRAVSSAFTPDEVITRSRIYFSYGMNWSLEDFGPYVVPKAGMKILLTPETRSQYRPVIGDSLENSLASAGSRSFVFQNDYLFLVGDNRPGSIDSRVFGPVPRTAVKGKAILKF